jgi:hypothetical protein
MRRRNGPAINCARAREARKEKYVMKAIRYIIPATAFLLLAGHVAAQGHEQAERAEAAAAAAAEAAAAKTESREAEVQRKLEDAERRMAEAARQIAELSAERLPQLAEIERRFEFYADGRPRLGVNIGEEKGDGPVEGVKIVGVSPGTAADDAGLRAGDIITGINGDSWKSSTSATVRSARSKLNRAPSKCKPTLLPVCQKTSVCRQCRKFMYHQMIFRNSATSSGLYGLAAYGLTWNSWN